MIYCDWEDSWIIQVRYFTDFCVAGGIFNLNVERMIVHHTWDNASTQNLKVRFLLMCLAWLWDQPCHKALGDLQVGLDNMQKSTSGEWGWPLIRGSKVTLRQLDNWLKKCCQNFAARISRIYLHHLSQQTTFFYLKNIVEMQRMFLLHLRIIYRELISC